MPVTPLRLTRWSSAADCVVGVFWLLPGLVGGPLIVGSGTAVAGRWPERWKYDRVACGSARTVQVRERTGSGSRRVYARGSRSPSIISRSAAVGSRYRPRAVRMRSPLPHARCSETVIVESDAT
jgi:hypothetical protein